MKILGERIYLYKSNNIYRVVIYKNYLDLIGIAFCVLFFIIIIPLKILSILTFIYLLFELIRKIEIKIDSQNQTITKCSKLFCWVIWTSYVINGFEELSFDSILTDDDSESSSRDNITLKIMKQEKKYYFTTVRKQKTFERLKALLENELKFRFLNSVKLK